MKFADRLLFGLSIPVLLCAAVPQPVVKDKIVDRFVPAPYQGQKIGGILGERMSVNLESRLLNVDEQAIVKGFHQRPGTHAWIGEHAGKFLHAAVNTWQYSGDERLKTLMDRVAKSVIAGQLPDGYLGTYTEDKRWTSWDVWSHKYNLIGLLSYYQATGYEPALDASRKMGDLLVKTFGNGPGQRDIIAASTHVGMAAGSVLEPICMLYRYTGDKRYLDFAYYILKSWEQPNGPHIIQSLLEHGSVKKTANAKAYEMMSCLVGLVDLYRLTGEEKFLKVAQVAWTDIATRRLYVTGTTSAKEHFLDDFDLPGLEISKVGEGCATVTWLQLSWQLLRITGEQKYAEELERTVYNQLLGAQDPQTGNICYFTALIGTKKPTKGINCCVSSEPRGISMIPQLAWGAREGGIAVLLYAPGAATMPMAGNSVKVESVTSFPDAGSVVLTLHPQKSARFPVALRVPQWSGKFMVKAGGKQQTGKPGEYVTINREWKAGDKIEISMEITTRVLPGGKSYPDAVAVQVGPQVLALEQARNPGLLDVQRAALKEAKPRVTPVAGKREFTVAGVAVVRDASGKLVKADRTLVLVPFMDAKTFSVWLTRQESLNLNESEVKAVLQ